MLQSKNLEETQKVVHEEFFWKTSDGKDLFAQKWDAGKSTRGAILLVHGYGEHSTRYFQWATSFAEKGFSVLSFDLRGHGKTPGKFGEYYPYQKYIDDLDLLIEQGRIHFKNTPLFLYGHSMGGNFVINYAITKALNINGVIVTSPWLELSNHPPRLLLSLINITSKIFPKILIKTPIKPEDLSRELREVHKYKTDPLVHNKLSLGLLSQLVHFGLIGKRSIYRINVPLLIMHGDADNVTSFNASKDFVRNAGPKTTFIEWSESFHELHNDIDREDVKKSIINWLNIQITK